MTTYERPTSITDPVDMSPEQRPGVPMEREPPRPMGHAHWQQPERQPDPGGVLKRTGLETLTPVFGTSVPPRGLSGLLRRAAYAIPEHFTTHWFVLLFADRVDVMEYRVRRIAPIALPVVALAGLAMFAASMPKRKTPLLRLAALFR